MTRARLAVVLLVVLAFQVAILYRIRIDGVVPDAMLLLAVCVGIRGGAERGAVVGFASGLAIDLFLQTTPAGLSALVFSLIGYGAGLFAEGTVRSAWWIPVLTAALASAAGEVLFGLTATVVGELRLVLPRLGVIAGLVAGFNAVLSPVVLRMTAWAVRVERA